MDDTADLWARIALDLDEARRVGDAANVTVTSDTTPARPAAGDARRLARCLAFVALVVVFVLAPWKAGTASAQTDPLSAFDPLLLDNPGTETFTPVEPLAPLGSAEPSTDAQPSTMDVVNDLSVSLDTGGDAISQPLTIVLVLTVVGLAPTLLVLLTSFTRIIVVLGITRNALSLQGIPPNQVLIGLALFLSIFVMAPVLTEVNDTALQPMLAGEISQSEAFDVGLAPFKTFMLQQVRDADLEAFIEMSGDAPDTPEQVSMTTLIPAFVMSELRAGFIIGFLVFVPFLIIDIVISATLMSMGMVMLPPVVISLPFKLLLFVIVDGWALLLPTIVTSFST